VWAFGPTVIDSVLIVEKTEGDRERQKGCCQQFSGKKLCAGALENRPRSLQRSCAVDLGWNFLIMCIYVSKGWQETSSLALRFLKMVVVQ